MFFRRSPSQLTPPDAKFMTALRKDLRIRYRGRLIQKLAGKEPVNIRKIPSDIGAMGEMMTLKSEQVPLAMLDLFIESNGRLLITGIPGAGKTTLLLQLAEALIEPARSELPVVLNLASWRTRFETIDNWLTEELQVELSTNSIGAFHIQQTVPLILLLDGLDEVPESDRPSCLVAIGEYGADANHLFVVSSRKGELKALEQLIPSNIYLPIEVAQLTPEQIETQFLAWSFNQPEAKPLLNATRQDAPLLEALRTPFYLNTAQLLFASGKRWEQFGFSETNEVEVRESELLEQFIKTALKAGWYDKKPEEVDTWLSYFAFQMDKIGLLTFELLNVQYSWFKWKSHQKVFRTLIQNIANPLVIFGCLGLIFGLLFGAIFIITQKGIMGMIYSLLIGPLFGFSMGIILGVGKTIIEGIFNGGYSVYVRIKYGYWAEYRMERIKTREKFNWSLVNKQNVLINAFIKYPLSVMGVVLFMSLIERHWNVYSVMELMNKDLIIFVIISFIAGLFITINDLSDLISKDHNYLYFPKITKPYQPFIASAKNLHFSIIQHFYLRLLLCNNRLLPWHLVDFLNDMAARHLLETDGATWRFRHRIIQEYFAKKWEDEDSRSEPLK